MGNQQGKADVRLYSGKTREEMQQNQPLQLRSSNLLSEPRPTSDGLSHWSHQSADRAQTQAEIDEEFRRRTSSVTSADMEPNWWYGSKSTSGESEHHREVIHTRPAAPSENDIPRNWWFPSTNSSESAVTTHRETVSTADIRG